MYRAIALVFLAPLLLGLTAACLAGGESNGIDRRAEWQARALDAGIALCGDGLCAVEESCVSCALDCGACGAACGDGACGAEESCERCPRDCGACPETCGDRECSAAESCETCPEDCGSCNDLCGDGICGDTESCETCIPDCGACGPVCGDDTCDLGETCGGCPEDCGDCPSVCGDDSCDADEDCLFCPEDCGTCSWPADWAAREEEMWTLVNDRRERGGECPSGYKPPVHSLRMDGALRESARGHSLDMARSAYFSHTSLDGRTPSQRMEAAGYSALGLGENIAGGTGSAAETFASWLESDGHCLNIMSISYNEIGVGYAFEPASPFRHYWTQNFGKR